MKVTERQGEILDGIIREYINSAQPIGSLLLEEKYDFGISPATIRNEMQELTNKGFLCQPHTSSGRVPTDKGYRFFVNKLLEGQELIDSDDDFGIGDWFKNEVSDTVKFVQSLTENLASESSTLVLSYWGKEKITWKDGWEEVLREPEFRESEYILNFAEFLEDFEKRIEDLKFNPGIGVYIGKENPFSKIKDFSIISSKCSLPRGRETILMLLGPKRMAYEKNICLMNALTKLMEKL